MKLRIEKYLYRILTLIFLISTFNSFAQPEPNDIKKSKSSAVIDGVFYYLHTVEKGQTLYSIAKAYGVKVEDITQLNADASTSIKPGQILKISVKEKLPQNQVNIKGDYFYYKVEPGETLYAIAQKNELKVDELLKYNPEAIDGIKAGDLLIIPGLPKDVKENNSQNKNTDLNKNKDVKQISPDIKANTNFSGQQSGDKNFRMAVFLPFNLGGLDFIETEKIKRNQADFPEKSKIAIEFYNGLLLAIDSMEKQGLKITLDVFDTGNDSVLKIPDDVKSKLDYADCILGPLYISNFTLISTYAKQKNIPIISALSQNNKILLGNEMVIKATPSLITQTEQMANYIGEKYGTENVLLMTNNNPKESVYNNTLKNIVNAKIKSQGVTSDSVKIVSTISGITEKLKQNKINVLVITNSNPSQITDVLSKLSKLREDRKKDSIIVFGMNSWQNIESIDYYYLNNLNVHIPEINYVDYNSAENKNLILSYRNLYKTEPSQYAFHGFDVAYYLMSVYKKYGEGKIIENIASTKWYGTHTGFWFYKSSVESGYENKYVLILRYADSELIPVNK